MQCVGNRFAVSNTIFFVPKSQFPKDRKLTYGRIVYDIKPHKVETHITRLTVGGNIINCPGEFTTPTADITTSKTLINITISTPDARFVCADMEILSQHTNGPLHIYAATL